MKFVGFGAWVQVDDEQDAVAWINNTLEYPFISRDTAVNCRVGRASFFLSRVSQLAGDHLRVAPQSLTIIASTPVLQFCSANSATYSTAASKLLFSEQYCNRAILKLSNPSLKISSCVKRTNDLLFIILFSCIQYCMSDDQSWRLLPEWVHNKKRSIVLVFRSCLCSNLHEQSTQH